MLEWWGTVEPLDWIARNTFALFHLARNYIRPQPPALNWSERLNSAFFDQGVRLYSILDCEPKLENLGQLQLTDLAAQRSEEFRKRLKINDPVAVLAGSPVWADNPVVLQFHSTDYASVCALDSLGDRPTMLSANVLFYCYKTKELILHRRAADISRDYAGALHTFGGAYMPPGDHLRDYDHLSLIRAARREAAEESGISFDLDSLPYLLIEQELKIGFVGLVLLGIGISKRSLDAALANHEGSITRVKSSDLPHALINHNWVPAGEAQVLAWLALGAPIGRKRVLFGKESGQKVFNRLIK